MIFKTVDNMVTAKYAYNIINKLESSYPNFYDWYWNKVIPDIMIGSGQIILGYIKSDLVGISIIKNGNEKKLRALRINDAFQSRGYGLHLIDESLKRLETDKPLCSVNENMINDYSRIFINRYNFDITYVYKNLYKNNQLEYEFNGQKTLQNKTKYGEIII